MDTPGRHELQKTYEDLHDEILLEIAQNVNHEYEKVAVEVARIELDKRGIDVPDSDDVIGQYNNYDVNESGGQKASLENLKWFGEKLTGPLIEIPRFSAEESVDIERLLSENKLPYEKRAVTITVGPEGGYHEYLFYVPRESFHTVITLLKEYFMVIVKETSTNYFSGKCPACGSELVNVENCTDCGLTLAGDYSGFFGNHPFMIFLKQNGLLN